MDKPILIQSQLLSHTSKHWQLLIPPSGLKSDEPLVIRTTQNCTALVIADTCRVDLYWWTFDYRTNTKIKNCKALAIADTCRVDLKKWWNFGYRSEHKIYSVGYIADTCRVDLKWWNFALSIVPNTKFTALAIADTCQVDLKRWNFGYRSEHKIYSVAWLLPIQMPRELKVVELWLSFQTLVMELWLSFRSQTLYGIGYCQYKCHEDCKWCNFGYR